MKIISVNYLFAFFLIFVVSSYAQTTAVPPAVRSFNSLERLTSYDIGRNPGAIIPGMPMEAPEIIGDTYLHPYWNRSAIMLYQNDYVFQNYLAKLDLYKNELDIRLEDGVKCIKGNLVRSFVLFDSLSSQPSFYINAASFKGEDGKPLVGFFEVLLEDSVCTLLKKTEVEIIKANYNAAKSVGSPDHKIIKKNMLFLWLNQKLLKVPSSKKKFLALLDSSHTKEVENFIKTNDINLKNEIDIFRVIQFYNQLMKEKAIK